MSTYLGPDSLHDNCIQLMNQSQFAKIAWVELIKIYFSQFQCTFDYF